MTAPVPRGGTHGREMLPCLCVWGARAACACGAGAGGAARHVGSHGSAGPGPAPVLCVTLGGGSGLDAVLCAGPWGGGARSYLCLPYTGTTRGRLSLSTVTELLLQEQGPIEGTHLLWCTPTAHRRRTVSWAGAAPESCPPGAQP